MSTETTAPIIPSLTDITLREIMKHFKSGTLTSAQLVRAYFSRIAEVDHEFNSVIELNPSALADAEACDKERASSHCTSPLHGVPILLKDNIPTLDGTNTTCGSFALMGAEPKLEAAVVTALRRAGSIILGKANMAAWAGFRSTSGCSGWSARGGQTYGPFVKGSKASGSSSGCAVATALGLCFAAVGTEMCHSIVSPAERSGIVGLKPTRDLLPSEGIIYASKKQDTVGVMARTVEDAWQITSSLIAQSSHQDLSAKLADRKHHAFSNGVFASAPPQIDLRGIRIGVPLDLVNTQDLPACKLEALGRALFRLETKGAKVTNKIRIPGWREYNTLSQEEKQIVMDIDMKLAINDYLADLETNLQNIRNLEDLISLTRNCSKEEYPMHNVAVLERAQATVPNSELYDAMVQKDEYFAGCIENALDQYSCDVLLIPSLFATLQTFAAKAGSPVLSIPIGVYPEETPIKVDQMNGLIAEAPAIPFSVYIFARSLDDETVLKVGLVIEAVMKTKEQLVPYMLPDTEVCHELL